MAKDPFRVRVGALPLQRAQHIASHRSAQAKSVHPRVEFDLIGNAPGPALPDEILPILVASDHGSQAVLFAEMPFLLGPGRRAREHDHARPTSTRSYCRSKRSAFFQS